MVFAVSGYLFSDYGRFPQEHISRMPATLPLCIAAQQGDLNKVKRLLQGGLFRQRASIDEKDKNNVSGKL